ncbi:MAG TPA: SGNH/GDSL hydrolase family protein [Kribbellaceae bacterium]|nr:SGNH/GDSL hydrolase family protein [Kribbellaceae bacterium]
MRLPLLLRPPQFRPVAVATVLSLAGSGLALSGSFAADDVPSAAGGPQWIGSWAAAVTHAEPAGFTNAGLNNQSTRFIVRSTVGGDRIRVRLSNLYGEQPVQVGAATVALPNTATADEKDIDPATSHALTFSGSASPTLTKGGELLSDPVDLPVGDLGSLVISVYFPVPTGPVTWHASSRQNSFYGAGNLVTDAGGAGYTTTRACCWLFLSGVDVQTARSNGAVVVLGDSIVDGIASSISGNNRWTDQLAERLLADARGGAPSVLNVGLAGSRLLHDGPEPGDAGFPGFQQLGVNALARLDEDVFSQTRPKAVITNIGVNDIWMNNESAERVIGALRQVNAQAKEHGLRSIAGTITPFEGLAGEGAWTPAKEATRQAVNAYLRSSTEFDALVDFDLVMRDPDHPSRLRAEFDSGDHIHPNEAGYQAMADAVPLTVLR